MVNDEASPKDVVSCINDFESGKLDVLICTRNINFNIKANKNCVAIVEDADRLGLSKLHQIRNFIISENHDATLCLVSSTKRQETLNKLKQIGTIMDGQALIQNDLKTRREGANLGFNK